MVGSWIFVFWGGVFCFGSCGKSFVWGLCGCCCVLYGCVLFLCGYGEYCVCVGRVVVFWVVLGVFGGGGVFRCCKVSVGFRGVVFLVWGCLLVCFLLVDSFFNGGCGFFVILLLFWDSGEVIDVCLVFIYRLIFFCVCLV